MLATHLIRLSQVLEAPVRWIGALLGVLVLLVVAGEFAVVLLRYGWQWSQTWLREGVLALNSAVFLLGAAYALQHDEHVRVDVLSRHWSPRTRAWVEVLGMLLLVLPFAVFVVLVSDQYVLQSWRIGERSQESSGLPALWVQKALIPTMALLLGVQALARAARFAAFLAGAPASGETQHGAVA